MTVKKITIAAIISLGLLLPILLSPELNSRVTDISVDILFQMRGSRNVTDEMFFIYIDSRDLDELNQWPITRDYYGYLTYILRSAGARVVGLDVLFTSENARYPEYDQDFSEFLRSAGNVCLPFSFADLSDTFTGDKQSFFLGTTPQFPIDLFRRHIIGSGFSNLLDDTVVRQALLAAQYNDSLYISFGLQLARLYRFGMNSQVEISPRNITLSDSSGRISIKTDALSRVRVNHFGSMKNVSSMSLVDVFQTYQTDPESLNVRDKLVFVGVTAPGTAPIKVTPYHAAFPASLVHFTVAENVLNNNFIRTVPMTVTALFIIGFAGLVCFIFSLRWQNLVIIAATLLVYVVVAVVLFKTTALAMPVVLPTLTIPLTSIVMLLARYREKSTSEEYVHSLYKEQIVAKQKQLQQAEATIHELEERHEQISAEAQTQLEEKQREILHLQKDLRDLQASAQEPVPARHSEFSGIIYASESAMAQVLDLVSKVSLDNIPVLISGETGTGKEVIARAIHESSERAKKSFIAVNCGALPETLIESELFGHEKGAFTGASSQRKGRFELADGGTLFLDEITETTAAFQAKLLRVLQEGTFERLGSERTIRVDVRIIAASSKNIQEQVNKELFREDLFYRLNGFPIELPPLRERQDDIPLLAKHFLDKHGYENVTALSERALEALSSYNWPGNVRELENSIRRAAILAQSDGRKMIQEIDLPAPIQETAQESIKIQYQSIDEQILQTLRSLKFSHSSISQTAQALGKDRGTITEYLRGFCFEHLVQADFDLRSAATSLAASDDQDVIEKVQSKMSTYIDKVQHDPEASTLYKGLPKKYHQRLDQLIQYIKARGTSI